MDFLTRIILKMHQYNLQYFFTTKTQHAMEWINQNRMEIYIFITFYENISVLETL